MSKSKKNVVEPDDILINYGIDATRLFMISDSPPDRELEWTDEGVQGSKNLTHRIEKYFEKNSTNVDHKIEKFIEKFIYNIENNILNFSLNKCVADIYTLFNYLEKSKVFLASNELSKKILVCLYPIVPRLTNKIYKKLFNQKLQDQIWPYINKELLIEENFNLPIQINGRMIMTVPTKKSYKEEAILKLVYNFDKIKNKIEGKKIVKVINVQDKIINIITN